MSFPTEQPAAAAETVAHTRRYWAVAVVCWIGVIFFSSTSLAGYLSEAAYSTISNVLFGTWQSVPGRESPLHLIADKGVHVTMFAVFAMLLWKALPDIPRKLAIVILAGTVLGCASEFLQSFFPDRDPAIRDVCINAAATALGALLISRLSQRRRNSGMR